MIIHDLFRCYDGEKLRNGGVMCLVLNGNHVDRNSYSYM